MYNMLMTRAKHNILVFSRMAEDFARHLERIKGDLHIHTARRSGDIDIPLEEVDILVSWLIRAELIAKMKNLKWIHSLGAGVDVFFREPESIRDIPLTRTIANLPALITQYVLGHILADNIGIEQHRQNQLKKNWEWLPFNDINSKTVLIVGTGEIGRRIGATLKHFDVATTGISRSGRQVEGIDTCYEFSHWNAAASWADYLVITLPLTKETQNLIGKAELGAINPEAMLINVGRGKVIDEAALISRLRSGKIRKAVLDVFHEEPLPSDNPLWSLPNVVITPHVAAVTDLKLSAAEFAVNYERFINGENLLNLVDKARGY